MCVCVCECVCYNVLMCDVCDVCVCVHAYVKCVLQCATMCCNVMCVHAYVKTCMKPLEMQQTNLQLSITILTQDMLHALNSLPHTAQTTSELFQEQNLHLTFHKHIFRLKQTFAPTPPECSLRTKSQKPKVQSQKSKAKTPKPNIQSQKPKSKTQRQKPNAKKHNAKHTTPQLFTVGL